MAKMGRPRIAEDSQHVGVRLPGAFVTRIDALAALFLRDGYSSDRASVLRAIVGLGLDALEKKHGIKRKK
jgi:hypothetical protein